MEKIKYALSLHVSFFFVELMILGVIQLEFKDADEVQIIKFGMNADTLREVGIAKGRLTLTGFVCFLTFCSVSLLSWGLL